MERSNQRLYENKWFMEINKMKGGIKCLISSKNLKRKILKHVLWLLRGQGLPQFLIDMEKFMQLVKTII